MTEGQLDKMTKRQNEQVNDLLIEQPLDRTNHR